VRFGTRAKEYGIAPGWTIDTVKLPSDRPPKELLFIPALLLPGLVMLASVAAAANSPGPDSKHHWC